MSCQKVMDKIKVYAEENNISLEEFSMKKRSPHIVTRSFHGAGIVVPYNKKTQLGYRHLVETDGEILILFLIPCSIFVSTNSQFQTTECHNKLVSLHLT